jgi:hypothetical protein
LKATSSKQNFNFKLCDVCGMVQPFVRYEEEYFCRMCGFVYSTKPEDRRNLDKRDRLEISTELLEQ